DMRTLGAAYQRCMCRCQRGIREVNPGPGSIDDNVCLDLDDVAADPVLQHGLAFAYACQSDMVEGDCVAVPLAFEDEFEAEPFGMADLGVVLDRAADHVRAQRRPASQCFPLV